MKSSNYIYNKDVKSVINYIFVPLIPPQNGKKSKDFKIEIDSYESIFLLLERNW